jgi:hypothetical protein
VRPRALVAAALLAGLVASDSLARADGEAPVERRRVRAVLPAFPEDAAARERADALEARLRAWIAAALRPALAPDAAPSWARGWDADRVAELVAGALRGAWETLARASAARR